METKLLSTCTANEAYDANSNCLSVLSQKDFSSDVNLTNISTKLGQKGAILLDSIGVEKKSEYTSEISNLDSDFDSSLICFKKFVDANLALNDSEKALKANKISSKIEANNPFLYKLGYEEQMTQALSLFSDLDQEEFQTAMADLYGVKESYTICKANHTKLQSMYRKGQEVKALKEKVIPSSVIKREVTDIINVQLIPYLRVLSDTQAEMYEETYTKIIHYIELVNTKIRTRRSRATTEEEVSSEVE
ncbi:DUF6261 family protein [Marinifilum fragile]|uniref:DUF6261 family protein n=1 Tax=Marinifilum fragile TaxID=570161 RepID=UPI002AA6557C|nr:DUF6261 family protein [Marinifilum fragile]